MNCDDKNAMIKIITETNEQTQNYTGKLSKAFLEHYEKYKKILSRDKIEYEENVKELSKESGLIIEEEKIENKYKKEYNVALEMLEKLKRTYAESESEAEYFDKIMIIVKKLFKNPKRLKTFVDGKTDGKCATTLLKTHIKNDML